MAVWSSLSLRASLFIEKSLCCCFFKLFFFLIIINEFFEKLRSSRNTALRARYGNLNEILKKHVKKGLVDIKEDALYVSSVNPEIDLKSSAIYWLGE